ncbi:MAG TPA: hypothetical protein V6D33_11955 [Cyanophyceae cyanobacterium]
MTYSQNGHSNNEPETEVEYTPTEMEGVWQKGGDDAPTLIDSYQLRDDLTPDDEDGAESPN